MELCHLIVIAYRCFAQRLLQDVMITVHTVVTDSVDNVLLSILSIFRYYRKHFICNVVKLEVIQVCLLHIYTILSLHEK